MGLIEEFLKTARSRLDNPLLGSFIISWLIINWDLVLLIFSELAVIYKINLIKEEYLILAEWVNLILSPLLSAIFFTFFLTQIIKPLEKKWIYPIEEERLKNKKGLIETKVGLETMEVYVGEIENLKTIILQKGNEITKQEEIIIEQKENLDEFDDERMGFGIELERIKKPSEELEKMNDRLYEDLNDFREQDRVIIEKIENIIVINEMNVKFDSARKLLIEFEKMLKKRVYIRLKP